MSGLRTLALHTFIALYVHWSLSPVLPFAVPIISATTSQSEADENRGRESRRREERLGKLERDYQKQTEDCEDGDRGACRDARETYDEIQELLPTIPVEPEN